MKRLVLAALLMVVSLPAAAVLPDEKLADPALEARARDISKGLRCLVCQNESIDDSNAPLAHDLRVIVRERLTQGDSDAAVVQYVVDRYGTYVLLEPPFQAATWVLWLTPLVLLAAGGVAAARFLRSRGAAGRAPVFEAPLSDEENRRLAALLSGSSGSSDKGRS